MINQTSRYALSLLCYLARHGNERVPARRIALDTQTPANYVSKILATLRKGGVVEGEKGWGGGYALRPRAGEISVGEVMALFEENVGPVACPFAHPECGCPLAHQGEKRVSIRHSVGGSGGVTCPFGGDCRVTNPCPLHGHWANVREGYWGMAGTRLRELTGGVVG
jgi:Rrf2 family protein